eukprot:5760588-Pleurochrysis_carterae.AAC.2
MQPACQNAWVPSNSGQAQQNMQPKRNSHGSASNVHRSGSSSNVHRSGSSANLHRSGLSANVHRSPIGRNCGGSERPPALYSPDHLFCRTLHAGSSINTQLSA